MPTTTVQNQAQLTPNNDGSWQMVTITNTTVTSDVTIVTAADVANYVAGFPNANIFISAQ